MLGIESYPWEPWYMIEKFLETCYNCMSRTGSNVLAEFVAWWGNNYEDVYGWLGFVLGLAAYLLLSIKRTKARYVTAQIMNLVAAELFIIAAYSHSFMQSIAFNMVWAVIATYYLIRYKKEV